MAKEVADFTNYTVDEALTVIDEALTYGFEFKVENHQIIFTDGGDLED